MVAVVVSPIRVAGIVAPRVGRRTPFRGERLGRVGDAYARHEHGYHKVLFCLSGSIVFHTDDGDIELRAGDRLDLEPGTGHAATVGPGGCRCVEASR